MTIRLLAALALGVTLAACSRTPDDREVIVNACVEDGSSQEACECMAGEAETALSEEGRQVLVLGAQGKDQEAQTLMQSMPLDQQLAFGTFAFEAIDKCGIASALAN
jgi:hypothetical protein